MEISSTRWAEVRARQALRAARLPYRDDLERASSTHNQIYMSERHVVRINNGPNQRLRRESLLYRHLPQRPWIPKMLAAGGEVGADYLIVERKPGVPLAHRWPELSRVKRREAVRELARHLQQIHATPTPTEVPRLQVSPHLLDSHLAPPVRPLLEGLEQLADTPYVDTGIIALAQEYVIDNWTHLDGFGDERLIHGDLTFENVLWDGRSISAVIDFEYCRGAPADLELDVLLRCCAIPEAHVAERFEAKTRVNDYYDVPSWLAEEYPQLFGHPNLLERLTLYALSFEVRDALSGPVPTCRGDISTLPPYRRLVALVSSGGHVADALYQAGMVV